MRVSTKIGLISLLFAFIVGPLVGFAVFLKTRAILEDQVARTTIQIAKDTIHHVEHSLSLGLRDIEMTAAHDYFQSFVTPTAHRPLETMQGELETHRALTGPWDALILTDADGNILSSAGAGDIQGHISQFCDCNAAYEVSRTGATYYTDLIISDVTGKPTVIFAAPVMRVDEPDLVGGVLIGQFSWSPILQVMSDLDPAISAHLFNRDGMAIADRNNEDDHLLEEDMKGLVGVQAALAGEVSGYSIEVGSSYAPDQETLAVHVLGQGWEGFDGNGWGVIFEIPTDLIFSQADRDARNIGILVTLLMALLAGAYVMLSRHLSRPLIRLEENAKELGLQAALAESEGLSQAITGAAQDGIIVIDNDGKIVQWNRAAEKIFGHTAEEALGHDLLSLIAPSRSLDGFREGWEAFRDTGQGNIIGKTVELEARTKDRGVIPIELSVSAANLKGKWHAIGVARDITERKAQEKATEENRKILQVVDHTLTSAISETEGEKIFDSILLDVLALTGSEYGFVQDYRIDDEGKPYMQGLAISNIAWDEETRQFYDEQAPKGFKFYDLDGLNGAALVTGEVVIANDPASHPRAKGVPKGHPPLNAFLGVPLKRGEKVVGTIGLANREGGYDEAIVDRLAPYWSACAEIIEARRTEEKHQEAERKIEHLARYDTLSGLPNRTSFNEQLESAVVQAKRTEKKFALMMLDIDHFKDINDTLGHPTGDQLLIAVSRRLSSVIRRSDAIARLGGDEFAILYHGLKEPGDVADYAQRVIDTLAKPFLIDEHQIHTGACVGISIYELDEADPKQLLRHADTALYRAKDEGRNQYRFHDLQMEAEVRERVSIHEELHEAIADGQFVLHYQPQIDIHRGCLVGVEALIRWNHPTRGLVPPNAFIPIAEDSGLLLEIDRWVLKTACRQMQSWRDQGLIKNATMGVNLSPLQFKTADFEEQVMATLKETGLDPGALDLELTERVLSARPTRVAEAMHVLHDQGVRFSIDDFGTGYSSLQYLKDLPVSKIKIAQEFVRDMLDDPGDASIVKAIIGLGNDFGHDVIAEGVETKEQLEYLRAKGCQLIQGYYFSKPKPADELIAWKEQSPFHRDCLAPKLEDA